MKLHHIALTVKDFSTSIPFYQEFFGFKEIKRFRRDDMKATGIFMEGENIIIELWQFDTTREGAKEELPFAGIKHIAFENENLDSLRGLFISKGIECKSVREGKSGGSYFFLSDPDNNQIEVYKSDHLS